MIEIVEFFWDEQTNLAHYLFENQYTGELREETREQSIDDLKWLDPEVDLRAKYFGELQVYLKTQDPYGYEDSCCS